MPLYEQMLAGTSHIHIAEHRFVMAKALGRPLRKNELVDHMDGNKQNNALSNLRIYVKGKNMPGETNGYGTFYHEWQLALAEVDRLKRKLRIREARASRRREGVGQALLSLSYDGCAH